MNKKFIDWLSDWWLTVLLLIIMFGLIILILFGEKWKCDNLTELDPDNQYNWTLVSGCRIKTPGGYWISVDDAKLLEIPDGVMVPIE